jgi:hypothetical protein
MTKTTCTQCGAVNEVPPRYIGQKVKCTHCAGDYMAQPYTAPPKKNSGGHKKGLLIALVSIVALSAAIGAYFVFNSDNASSNKEVHSDSAKPEEIKKVKVSGLFRDQLMKFLESGSQMKSLSEQGLSYIELRTALADVRGKWDLTKSTWPKELDTLVTVDSFEKSIEAWDACLELWKLKIDKKDNPTSPDINRWSYFTTNFKDDVVIRTYGSDFLVANYRDREHLPFDENISALLGAGTAHFWIGREVVLQQIE